MARKSETVLTPSSGKALSNMIVKNKKKMESMKGGYLFG
jgi:hypothetical protein